MTGASKKIEEVAPFTVMVLMEGCTIALTILAKTAMSNGMSPFVFVVYTNAISTLLLLPYSFLFHRERTEYSFFSLPLILRFFFLGLIGIALSQNLAFLGLSYSSPYVVCTMGLLIPAFSFILSVILRMTKIELSSPSFRFKVTGALITITGALIVAFYKGPFVKNASSSTLKLHRKQHLLVFYSTPDHWVLGGFLLAGSSLCVSVWNLIQMGTMKQYPQLQVMKVAAFYSLAGTIQTTIFCLFMERDLDAWKLQINLELLLIVITAMFASVVRGSIHVLFTRMKGRFYVPLFQPFRIFWATFFGVTFFANSLHYGSIIGTVICGVGYYTIMWGQAREDESYKPRSAIISVEKLPLLQDQDTAEA
ncbi:WAT1-related protein At1g70260 [Mercurialis annua]|uniref:WAT1-related protein At1g70260 n=1 Tax=Mercurialis annua TaxID=3986 RepID=UPI00215FB5E1|nr:WAT1-related protein At1g70260 [Mercurialis annua]XP_050235761.1 WAT1-related protein At1g70260 [Mercurialis annua]